MSYARIPPTAPARPRSGDAVHGHTSAEQPLSANAEAWRRLAVVGYHRAAEMVRANQPASDAHAADVSTDALSTDAHQSGFQNL